EARTRGNGFTMMPVERMSRVWAPGSPPPAVAEAAMSPACRLIRAALALAIALTATLSYGARPARAFTPIYFPQTGHALGYHFKVYWQSRGALRAFGYPLSEEFTEDGRATQYFERAVFQYFPEYAGT